MVGPGTMFEAMKRNSFFFIWFAGAENTCMFSLLNYIIRNTRKYTHRGQIECEKTPARDLLVIIMFKNAFDRISASHFRFNRFDIRVPSIMDLNQTVLNR